MRKKKLLILVLFVFALIQAKPAVAREIFKNEAAGIQFDVPNGWKVEPDGELITITAPDDTVSIVFWAAEEETFDAAVDAFSEEISKVIQNIRPSGKPTTGTLNGLAIYGAEGTGEIDGTKILWSSHLIQGKKPVIALSFGAPGLWEKHAATLDRFVNSIKRIR
jgi:hypothetical protein